MISTPNTAFNPDILTHLYHPPADSHKGQNGKLLVIGGSRLFHASIFWSADTASRLVDMVHFTSPANENNDLVRQQIKSGFWNGIVVDWSDVDNYIEEDDAILIGPGMSRASSKNQQPTNNKQPEVDLSQAGKEDDTKAITSYLLAKYPHKKWIIDGGALQEVDPSLINQNCILTPHHAEFDILLSKVGFSHPGGLLLRADRIQTLLPIVSSLSVKLNSATILLKGSTDIVCQADNCITIPGGNPGMTKGGTGDVLAGLVAGLYCKNDALLSAQAASYLTKKAGDQLYQQTGTFFNSSDLVIEVGKVWGEFSQQKLDNTHQSKLNKLISKTKASITPKDSGWGQIADPVSYIKASREQEERQNSGKVQ